MNRDRPILGWHTNQFGHEWQRETEFAPRLELLEKAVVGQIVQRLKYQVGLEDCTRLSMKLLCMHVRVGRRCRCRHCRRVMELGLVGSMEVSWLDSRIHPWW